MAPEDNTAVSADALKAAELALRQAVEAHGTMHPVVLEKLESYVALARQAGQHAQADKLEEKARILRTQLSTAAAGSNPALAAAPASAPSAAASAPAGSTAAPTPAPAASTTAAPPAVAAAAEPAASSPQTPADDLAPAGQSASPISEAPTAEQHLYNSKGEHIAVAFEGNIYAPSGKFLARWDESLQAFIDERGWYFGHILDGNRVGKDPLWQFRHMNFGVQATAGSRIGWSKQPDTDRRMLPDGYIDIEFPEE